MTLATHDMRRAMRFCTAVGFDPVSGGEDAGFARFRAAPGS